MRSYQNCADSDLMDVRTNSAQSVTAGRTSKDEVFVRLLADWVAVALFCSGAMHRNWTVHAGLKSKSEM